MVGESWYVIFRHTHYDSSSMTEFLVFHRVAHITKHNSSPSSFTLNHNDFSDLTNDEFQQKLYLGKYSPGIFTPKGRDNGKWISSERRLRQDDALDQEYLLSEDDIDTSTVAVVPDEINWVEKGAVTDVKNQWCAIEMRLSLCFIIVIHGRSGLMQCLCRT